jgi:hypothetical protein
MKEFIGLWPLGLIVLILIVSLVIPERKNKPTGIITADKILDDASLAAFKKEWRESTRVRKMVDRINENHLLDEGLSPKEKKAFKT